MSLFNKKNMESNAFSGRPQGPAATGSSSPQVPSAGPVVGGQSSGFSKNPGTLGASGTGNFRRNGSENKQEVVSITYEEIGLFPRSFSRVLDRFLKQVFSDVENLVIQEYRFYRYLFLTTFKSLLILFFVPFFVNFLAKNYVVRPLTEYFWNTKQTEIFLNSYQQKRAFAELKDFEEKLYFESLIYPKSPERATSHQVSTHQNAPSLLGSPTDSSMGEGMTAKETEEGPYTPVNVPKEKSQSDFSSENVPNAFSTGSSVGGPGGNQKGQKLKEKDSMLNQTLKSTLSNETKMLQNQGGLAPVGSLADNLSDQKPLLVSQIDGIPTDKGNLMSVSDEKTESLIHSYTLKSSLFVYQTREADKNIQQRYQEKTIELAQRYNDQSIEAITNFFADLISLLTLFYLLYALEIQINITKSFLLEVFFGLDDSKKSLLILLVTDLLVGYHSSNLWELFFEFLFNHYGLPESQTGIFLLVATLPVLLDVLFKYLIFRHLNRSSPATVATYHAMIE